MLYGIRAISLFSSQQLNNGHNLVERTYRVLDTQQLSQQAADGRLSGSHTAHGPISRHLIHTRLILRLTPLSIGGHWPLSLILVPLVLLELILLVLKRRSRTVISLWPGVLGRVRLLMILGGIPRTGHRPGLVLRYVLLGLPALRLIYRITVWTRGCLRLRGRCLGLLPLRAAVLRHLRRIFPAHLRIRLLRSRLWRWGRGIGLVRRAIPAVHRSIHHMCHPFRQPSPAYSRSSLTILCWRANSVPSVVFPGKGR